MTTNLPLPDRRDGSARECGIAVLRIVVGAVFVAHGAQKLFVYHVSGVADSFAGMGLPVPMVSATLATAAEFGCGLLLVLGLFTRLAAIPLAITMLVAWATVHRHAFFLQNKGAEYVIVLLAATVALVLSGPGGSRWTGLYGRRRPAAP